MLERLGIRKKNEKDPKEHARECYKKVYPHIGPISYKAFKECVLPIISEEEKYTMKNLKAYHDPKLPSYVQSSLRSTENFIRFVHSTVCIIVPWTLARAVADYSLTKSIAGGTHILHKTTLTYAALIGVPMFPLLFKGLSELSCVNVDKSLMAIKKDEQLSKYRKRLLEAYPDYANLKYIDDKALQAFDGVAIEEKEWLRLQKKPEPEKPKEEPDFKEEVEFFADEEKFEPEKDYFDTEES